MRDDLYIENLFFVGAMALTASLLLLSYHLHASIYQEVYEKDQKETYRNGFSLGFTEKLQSVRNLTVKKISQSIASAHKECKHAIEQWEQKQKLGERKRESSKTPALTIYDIFEYKKAKYCTDEIETSMILPCLIMKEDAEKREEDKESKSIMEDIIQAESDAKHIFGRGLSNISISLGDFLREPISPQYPAILGPTEQLSSAFLLPNIMASGIFLALGAIWFLKRFLHDTNLHNIKDIYGFENEPTGNVELAKLIQKAEEKGIVAESGDAKACQIDFTWTHQPVRIAGDVSNLIYDLQNIKTWLNNHDIYPGINKRCISKTLTRAKDVEDQLIKHLKKLLSTDHSRGKSDVFASPETGAGPKKRIITDSKPSFSLT
jgi:hypothetical protein